MGRKVLGNKRVTFHTLWVQVGREFVRLLMLIRTGKYLPIFCRLKMHGNGSSYLCYQVYLDLLVKGLSGDIDSGDTFLGTLGASGL